MSLLHATILMLTLAPAALKWDVPPGWVSQKPASSMRVAEFTLPKAAGDTEDGQLALYFFGGQGGSVQANLDRWISQMTQPDGKASKDVAKTTTMKTKSGLAVTLVDVTGTYVAEVSPGSGERFNKPGFRLRAAVVETPEGPYFVKLTGPAKTIARWDVAFGEFLGSLRPASADW
jgi:hypothetical protein